MAIDEAARHHLHQTLDERIGAADAATLMAYLPPVGWADVTTKTDLDHLRVLTQADLDHLRTYLEARIDQAAARLDARIDQLEAHVDQMEARFDARIDQMEARFDTQIGLVRSDVRTGIAGVQTQLAETKSELFDRIQRQNHILLATLVPFALAVLGLLAAAVFRTPTP